MMLRQGQLYLLYIIVHIFSSLLAKYYDHKIKEGDRVRHVACMDKKRNGNRVLVGKANGKKQPRHRWKDNKMDVNETWWRVVNWISWFREQWWSPVNMVMNLQVPLNVESFLTS
jgi:hypothetical protein